MKPMRLGFVGTGIITEAIVTGLLKANVPVKGIAVSSRSEATARRLSALSPLVRIGRDNQDVVEGADVVFLAVRPQIAESVVRPLQIPPGTLVASLIATVPIATVRDWVGADVEVIRSVPLPSAATLASVTVIYPASPKLAALFNPLGSVIECQSLDEFDAFAVAGGLMGTYFGFAEICAQWMSHSGVPYEKARAYLAPVFHGLASRALREPGESFEDLRISHSTAGGLNEQLFVRFREQGGEAAVLAGLDAVAARIRAAHAATTQTSTEVT